MRGKRKRVYGKKAFYRSGFDMDYERIIYSSSLRRLQDKAQVFPLQENDFTRTRLTHSIEVSSLGRSIGRNIGSWLEEKEDSWSPDLTQKLSSVLAVSCLVHDLGNPPFGHFGETIIRNWFSEWFQSRACKTLRGFSLDGQEQNDFRYFEGNAQTLRILTKLQFLNDDYGVNFTYGTLSALIKYPFSSAEVNEKNKKVGYFKSEQPVFLSLREKTGLSDHMRNPVTFLLELADDIAYMTSDFEDGVKKQLIPWKDVYGGLKKELGTEYKDIFDRQDKTNERIEGETDLPEPTLISAQNFRIAVQGKMLDDAVEAFKAHYCDIMNGKFEGELLDCSNSKKMKDELKEVARKYCFDSPEVLTLELIGNSVLDRLLDMFVSAVLQYGERGYGRSKNGKLFSLISPNFKYIQRDRGDDKPFNSLYNRLMLVTDYISGMTDSFAVNLNNKLAGTVLP